MTEAGWTRERPTKEGVYWFRWGKDRDAIIVLVLIEYGDWRVMEMGHQHSGALAGYVTGEFLGPITPDSYQRGRVDSLEKQVEELEMEIKRRVWLSHGSRMKHLLYGDDGKMDCNSCGRDYAAMPLEVAQRYELDDAIKLAQQAQEGGVGDGN